MFLKYFLAFILGISLCIVASYFGISWNNHIDAVVVHPPLNRDFTCSEHWEGQLEYIGDALGKDCIIQKFTKVSGLSWMRSYKGNGSKNEYWYGWHADVLAPFSGKIEDIYINPKINSPGTINKSRASGITFLRDDGVKVDYGHVTEVTVKIGERVNAGQIVAKVGNNGWAYHPHIHIGAWKNKKPLQIRFDLKTIGKIKNPIK